MLSWAHFEPKERNVFPRHYWFSVLNLPILALGAVYDDTELTSVPAIDSV